jgi:hypothetical protein
MKTLDQALTKLKALSKKKATKNSVIKRGRVFSKLKRKKPRSNPMSEIMKLNRSLIKTLRKLILSGPKRKKNTTKTPAPASTTIPLTHP